jgi:D-amino-acid dehydrogenase
MTLHVVVVGAGIVGASCALALRRDGHRVTLVEPAAPGGPQAASFGNGAWISPASIVPMSMPGLWRKVPGFLRDPAGPFVIRPAAVPRLLPWLVRFLLAGATTRRVERTARALRPLLEDAPERHAALAAEAGVSDTVRRTGLLYVYPSRAAFESEALAWRLRRDGGVSWTELDAPALRAREPDLSPRYTFGIDVAAGAHCSDPGAYVVALVRHAQAQAAPCCEPGRPGSTSATDSCAPSGQRAPPSPAIGPSWRPGSRQATWLAWSATRCRSRANAATMLS